MAASGLLLGGGLGGDGLADLGGLLGGGGLGLVLQGGHEGRGLGGGAGGLGLLGLGLLVTGTVGGGGALLGQALGGGAAHHLRDGLGLGVVLDDVEDDGGDVVRSAGAQGQVDELVGGLTGVGDAGQDLTDGLSGHRAAQAVGAQQPAVAGNGLADRLVELDLALGVPQDAQEDRALGVLAGLVPGEAPGLHEVLHEGVVGGDLGEGAVAQHVGARVAHVDHGELVAAAHDADAGGAQAGEVGVLRGQGDELGVGGLDGVAHEAQQLAGLVGVGVQGHEVLDGDRRGDVSARRSAHPVAQKAQVGAGVARVLVGLADQADVGACGEAQGDGHERSSSVVWPILTGMFMGSSTAPCTGRPSIMVPLVDPRSSSHQAPSLGKTRAWRDEA